MRALRWALGLCALALSLSAPAQIAKIMSVQGTAMLERAGQKPRILGVGDAVDQKDTISVAQQSNALLQFNDQTRITLRPNTVFRVNEYSESAPRTMVMGLVKGGIRAVTGEIAKREPTAVRFQTNTAIIGVRGTEFDARLCEQDCSAEERTKPQPRAGPGAAARVIDLKGSASAGAQQRGLTAGAAIFSDETLTVGPGSHAVIAFRDGTRVTLGEKSELDIVRFDYDVAAPQKGQARLKLRSGTAHVYTGALAKTQGAFVFETQAGAIHPQGTGFSVSGDEVLIVHTWDGTVIIQTATERLEIKKGDTLAIQIVDGKVSFLPKPPQFLVDATLPRPDGVTVDPATFGEAGATEQGLYVWVRDGAVVLDRDKQVIEVPAGQAALATKEKFFQLNAVPNFMRFDQTPRPNLQRTGGQYQLPFFRRPDGSVMGMCRP